MRGASGSSGAASIPRALLRDPIAVATLVVWALAALPYALPVDPAWLEWYGSLGLYPPLLVMIPVACFAGLRRLESPPERQFWMLVGAAFVAYLLTYPPYYVVPAAERGLGFEVGVDFVYLLHYVCLLLALDVRAHLATLSPLVNTDRWLTSLGAVLLATAAAVYFVLIPAAVNPREYGTWLPSLSLFLVLDAFVLIRLIAMAARAGSSRWRLLYGALGAASGLMLMVDLLEYLGLAGFYRVQDGRPTDLIWTLPLVAYALSARLPHHATTPPATVPFLEAFESSPVRTGSFLLLCAFTLPVIHFALYLAGLLDFSAHNLRESVALGSIVVLGGLAVVAYRMLDRERLALRLRQQRLESRLRRVEQTQAVGRLAEGLAHDFSNLLQVIGGRCDPVLAQLPLDSPFREDLEAIRAAARRMTALAVRVLDLVRTEFAPPELVRLSDIVRDAERLVRPLVGDEVRVETRVRARRDVVRVDPQQIERVLLAIAANARDAMPDGGTLVIETFDIDVSPHLESQLGLLAGPYAAISVADTGSGMSEETLRQAFQPFFTTRSESEHAGLGLTSALHIASHYGGTILIDSELGRGATVTLFLPRAEARVLDTAAPGSVEDTLRLRTIVPRLSDEA